MSEYQILYWHDIPIQVRAGSRAERVSQELSDRFQVAIDNAAMAAGLVGDDAYLEGFNWSETQTREGEPQEVLNAVIAEIEQKYPVVNWQQTAEQLKKKS
jgi:hypothetical protein